MTTPDGDTVPHVDVYLVGLGIAGIWHLTREAEACLRASRSVFTVDPGFGVQEHIASLGPEVHDLLGEYREGGNRLDTYRRMAARVIEAALDDPPACLAVYGHPTFLVHPSVLIQRAAQPLGLDVYVAAGISSLDTMLVDLNIDAAFNGLQIYDASIAVIEDRALDPEVPCLLLQPDAVGSAFFTTNASKASRFDRLRDHLLRFYPADHVVTAVRSSTFAGFEPDMTSFPLRDLSAKCEELHVIGSLHVPPARQPTRDEELVRQTLDPLNLNRITYPPSD